MNKSDRNKDLSKLSFETALNELEKIVEELEAGETDLDSSIAAYERGIALKQHCAEKLKQAELRVQKIETKTAGIAHSTKPLEDD
ncbi:MAG: exodeoxyribonuclease VII small subunit [Gammaproteobacteria bacterium]|jgi:exodeoxyribonuclease VII small subunit|nr:exodeoxyribonuclease VII small subunit [Gammaproteobacteria bacterium]|tara:strand:+ start:149 stop:403 length:255 start_codon:yes stop_codon:yes gene_type:complete